MQTDFGWLDDGRVELLYDEGPLYQECVNALNKARNDMPHLRPRMLLVNKDYFYSLVREAEYDFSQHDAKYIYVSVQHVPLRINETIDDDEIIVTYETNSVDDDEIESL